MTRDEAIAKFTIESDLDDLAPAIVDGLEGLGLLKLDAPPKTLWNILREHEVDFTTAQRICNQAMIHGITHSPQGTE